MRWLLAASLRCAVYVITTESPVVLLSRFTFSSGGGVSMLVGQALARLGASRRNFVVRRLMYALYFVRGIPEAIKVWNVAKIKAELIGVPVIL